MPRKRTTSTDPRLDVLDLSDAESRTVARHATIVVAPAGRELFAEGMRRPQLVWLLTGHAVVARGGVPVAVLGPGDVVGEITMVTDQRTSTADVVVLEAATVAALSVQEWHSVADEAPGLAHRMQALAERRLAA
jgi:CRP-like cAMP-binding protein